MKLSTRLTTLILALSAIPLATVGWMAFSNGRRALQAETQQRLLEVNQLKENDLAHWIQDRETYLRLLASRPGLREALAILNASRPDSPDYRAAYQQIQEDYLAVWATETGGFDSLALLRASDGFTLASTTVSDEGQIAADEPYFAEGKDNTYVGDVVFDPAKGGPLMMVSTPINDLDGALVAVLVGQANLSQIATIMQQGVDLSPTEETILVNTSYYMVTSSRFQPGEVPNQTVRTTGIENCLAHNEGFETYQDYRGVTVISVYRWLPDRNLCILTKADQAVAFAPVIQLRNATLAIAVVATLLAALAGVLLSLSVTRPVQALVRGAREIGSGNLDYRTGLASPDEIGELSQAFDQMAANLKAITASRDDLNKEVATRKQAEQALTEKAAALARSNADLEQFAYVASHDLQEPLRMVASYTQLLARRYQGQLDSDADEFIAYAVDGATRMQKLINDLLGYSRVGTRGKDFMPTSCEAILEQVLSNLQLAIEESGAVITHDPLPVVTADEGQIEQLLQNLIANAIKFRGETSPRIHVAAEEKKDSEWAFSVRDNGIGFDAKQYNERVFVIFQRLHGKGEYPGTGIGLALCKRIVERHGGRIWAESQPGEGATFYFTLPTGGN